MIFDRNESRVSIISCPGLSISCGKGRAVTDDDEIDFTYEVWKGTKKYTARISGDFKLEQLPEIEGHVIELHKKAYSQLTPQEKKAQEIINVTV